MFKIFIVLDQTSGYGPIMIHQLPYNNHKLKINRREQRLPMVLTQSNMGSS